MTPNGGSVIGAVAGACSQIKVSMSRCRPVREVVGGALEDPQLGAGELTYSAQLLPSKRD